MRSTLFFFLFAFTSLASFAQENGSPIVASGWCAIQSKHQDSGKPGCDVGAGISLYRYKKISLVGVIGSKTIGAGIGYVVYEPTKNFSRYIGIAFGVVARYDSNGIYREIYPALGATMTFGSFKKDEE